MQSCHFWEHRSTGPAPGCADSVGGSGDPSDVRSNKSPGDAAAGSGTTLRVPLRPESHSGQCLGPEAWHTHTLHGSHCRHSNFSSHPVPLKSHRVCPTSLHVPAPDNAEPQITAVNRPKVGKSNEDKQQGQLEKLLPQEGLRGGVLRLFTHTPSSPRPKHLPSLCTT